MLVRVLLRVRGLVLVQSIAHFLHGTSTNGQASPLFEGDTRYGVGVPPSRSRDPRSDSSISTWSQESFFHFKPGSQGMRPTQIRIGKRPSGVHAKEPPRPPFRPDPEILHVRPHQAAFQGPAPNGKQEPRPGVGPVQKRSRRLRKRCLRLSNHLDGSAESRAGLLTSPRLDLPQSKHD